MRLISEEQLLDQTVRAKIIEEIEDSENKRRKDEHYKRYQCYKDQTHLYVVKQLLKQFDQSTVVEMAYAISNIGFVRKIIDKLARVYKYGCERSAESEADTEKIQELSDIMNINAAMKKTNRFFKLDKNTVTYICPKRESLEENAKKILKVLPLQPFLYDVVELHDDREKPGCYILSDYESEDFSSINYSLNPASANRTQRSVVSITSGDRVDQIIADTPEDQQNYGTNNNKQYIFWSNKYHFTCNKKGHIVNQGEIENPIGEIPFVNFAEDQDGSFWAKGGDDLADGGILVNSMISNVNHIAITQGYGQLVMTGKNLPRNAKVGPNKAILLEYMKDEDPVPTFDFKTANPPLDQLRALLEMYVALLLTTNNLTTSGVSTKLDGGMAFPSGIAMLIDKAESMEDVEDQRQIFVDNEPLIWKKIAKWQNVLKNSGELSDTLTEYVLPTDIDVDIKFNQPVVIQTEKEKLEVIKMKMELGMITKVDMLRAEYPDLSDEKLKEKLEEIMQEKLDVINQGIGNQGNQPGDINNAGAGAPGEHPQVDPNKDQEGRGRVPGGANPK